MRVKREEDWKWFLEAKIPKQNDYLYLKFENSFEK